MIVTRSRRSFAQALRRAGLEPPTEAKRSLEHRQQVGRLLLELLVRGVDHRTVGSARWAVLILGFLPADLVDSSVPDDAAVPDT